ncbi:hypothetical protein Misp06_03221 [Microbulbifer sp. NBRC 101763]|uniref:esterase-like activity of phytase family protein n=1 Tax=Microbulbifer TaxID=48073 RepID=UPI00035F6B5B|nr:esterase-like activity of phytase family protein [Microbulbifer variabilis]
MIKSFLYVITGVLLSVTGVGAEVIPAKKINHYWLDGSVGEGISGLSFCYGELLTISDKNSREIFTLKREGRHAKLASYLQLSGLTVPQKDKPRNFWHFILDLSRPVGAMDFEGITCSDKYIYIVSERYNRILEVDRQGNAHWLDAMWTTEARARGYMQGFNLASEGLVKIGDDFWVAMESEPRGLVKLSPNGDVQLFTPPPVAGLNFRGEPEDLGALDYYDGGLFTLERNAYAVCRRVLPSLKAEWCLDYREIEKSSELQYEGHRTGGKGDGLAVGKEGIFIVFDNDNISRSANPQDRRALLLHLAFPERVQ